MTETKIKFCGLRREEDVKYAASLDAGFFGGVKVAEDTIMLAVTEKCTKEEIDALVASVP